MGPPGNGGVPQAAVGDLPARRRRLGLPRHLRSRWGPDAAPHRGVQQRSRARRTPLGRRPPEDVASGWRELAIDGQRLLFVGHSEAGKSTTMLLVSKAPGARTRIMCESRSIVRSWPGGFAGGPLRAILFLEQSHGLETPVTVFPSYLQAAVGMRDLRAESGLKAGG